MHLALKHLLLGITLIYISSCQQRPSADDIVDKMITQYGGDRYESIHISFDFRDKHYVIHQHEGMYQYERIFSDSTTHIRDVLNNDGFTRFINDQKADLNDAWKTKYANSVNSVVYFALLPHGLNDPAVIKTLAGNTAIDGDQYYLVHVKFRQEGGGKDHEDEFMYWINKKHYSMDYMGYFYYTDGGGTRFRKAVNVREVNGITFSDYLNYGFDNIEKDLSKLDEMYLKNELNLISEIRLKNIEVSIPE